MCAEALGSEHQRGAGGAGAPSEVGGTGCAVRGSRFCPLPLGTPLWKRRKPWGPALQFLARSVSRATLVPPRARWGGPALSARGKGGSKAGPRVWKVFPGAYLHASYLQPPPVPSLKQNVRAPDPGLTLRTSPRPQPAAHPREGRHRAAGGSCSAPWRPEAEDPRAGQPGRGQLALTSGMAK